MRIIITVTKKELTYYQRRNGKRLVRFLLTWGMLLLVVFLIAGACTDSCGSLSNNSPKSRWRWGSYGFD